MATIAELASDTFSQEKNGVTNENKGERAETCHTVFRWRHRPVLAVPATHRHLQLLGLRQFGQLTWKRSCFRAAASAFVVTGAMKLLGCRKLDSELELHGFDFNGWLNHMRSQLGALEIQAFVVWPSQPERKRLYVHLMSNAGELLGFAKISLIPEGNARILKEIQFLDHIENRQFRTFRSPRILVSGRWDMCQFVVCEPLPKNTRCVPHSWHSMPIECVTEYSGTVHYLSYVQATTTDWWQHFEQTFPDRRITGLVHRDIESGLATRFVHGDLGPGNILLASGRTWIIDWENADEFGPAATDDVAFFLALNQLMVFKRSKEMVSKLKSQFQHHADIDSSVLAALAYLHTRGVPAATRLLSSWS